VTVVEPDLVSLVAVMVAVPAFTAVTSPLELTVAIVGSLVPHVTVRPVRVFPFESLRVADNWRVAPRAMEGLAGATVTVATGASATLNVDVPLWPSLVAVIVDVPGATPVTTPAADNVATLVFDDCQPTVRPLSVFPLASFKVAVMFVVNATKTLAGFGATLTELTGATVTVIADVPFFPPLVAVMVAVPGATPVTSPVADTVAMFM
jgi:hypothetical protein